MWLHTLFDSLKPQCSRTPVQHARHGAPRRRQTNRRLVIEALEQRAVPASLTLSDVSLLEGNNGTHNAVAMVSLSAPKNYAVTVKYNTANGTALAGSDYRAVSGKLTFAPGQTSKSIRIPLIGDRLVELDETFFVKLHNPIAKIADGRGVVTIMDDEPRISINSVALAEGSQGTTLVTFAVSLSAPSDNVVTVKYVTADGNATTADNDYFASRRPDIRARRNEQNLHNRGPRRHDARTGRDVLREPQRREHERTDRQRPGHRHDSGRRWLDRTAPRARSVLRSVRRRLLRLRRLLRTLLL